jgi:hypothetical protein
MALRREKRRYMKLHLERAAITGVASASVVALAGKIALRYAARRKGYDYGSYLQSGLHAMADGKVPAVYVGQTALEGVDKAPHTLKMATARSASSMLWRMGSPGEAAKVAGINMAKAPEALRLGWEKHLRKIVINGTYVGPLIVKLGKNWVPVNFQGEICDL